MHSPKFLLSVLISYFYYPNLCFVARFLQFLPLIELFTLQDSLLKYLVPIAKFPLTLTVLIYYILQLVFKTNYLIHSPLQIFLKKFLYSGLIL